MNYRLMSIDESSKISGCALFENGELTDYLVIDKRKIKDSSLRLHEMCKEVLETMKLWNPNGIYIEHPQGSGSNVLTVGMLSEIIGVARAYAIEHECDFEEIAPSVWRRLLKFKQGGGKKRAELKQMSIDYVKERYDITASDDLADAICIGTAVIDQFEVEEIK